MIIQKKDKICENCIHYPQYLKCVGMPEMLWYLECGECSRNNILTQDNFVASKEFIDSYKNRINTHE